MRAKNRVASRIRLVFRMLATVEFDYQPGGVARKIGDERAHGHPPAKFVFDESAISEQLPQGVFVRRRLVAKASRKTPEAGRDRLALRFSPCLLPLWEKVARSAG